MTFSLRVLALMVAASSVWGAPNGTNSCRPLDPGNGAVPFPDTAAAFQSLDEFGYAAALAPTPEGYVKAYSNLTVTYNEARMYVGYFLMESYDVKKCARACDLIRRCNAFNIFFERSPLFQPEDDCPNPPSTTLIKCDLWSGTILKSISLNHGQWRQDFHVVMAGSNAYVKDIDTDMPEIDGYTVETYGDAAITAPADCNGRSTYIGVRYWHDGRFDVARCVDACEAATGSEPCKFMNTYMQRKDNVPYSQHCAMYTHRWPPRFATNKGQWRGSNQVGIQSTNSFGITRDDGYHDACLPWTFFAPALSFPIDEDQDID